MKFHSADWLFLTSAQESKTSRTLLRGADKVKGFGTINTFNRRFCQVRNVSASLPLGKLFLE